MPEGAIIAALVIGWLVGGSIAAVLLFGVFYLAYRAKDLTLPVALLVVSLVLFFVILALV